MSSLEILNVCADYIGIIVVALLFRVMGMTNGVMWVVTCSQSKLVAFEVLGVPVLESFFCRLGFCMGGDTRDHVIDLIV